MYTVKRDKENSLSEEKKESARPGLVSWTVATLSTLAVAGTWLIADAATTGLQVALFQRGLVEALTTEPRSSVAAVVHSMGKLPPAASLSIPKITEVISLLKKGEFENAYTKAEELPLPAQVRSQALRKGLGQLSETQEVLKSQHEHQIKLSRRLESLRKVYFLIRDDLYHKLELPFPKSSDEAHAEYEALIHYESGILEKLPMIKDVPDGVTDKEQLRTLLRSYFGPPSNKKKRVIPDEALASLRAQSRGNRENLVDVGAELSELQNEIDIAESDVKRLSLLTERHASNLIVRLATPPVEKDTVATYTALHAWASGRGYELPELRVVGY